MTRTTFLFIAFSLFLFGVIGCEKNELKIIDLEEDQYRTDDVLYAKSAKLKRILHTYNISDGYYNTSEEYRYDKKGSITRVSFKSFEGEEYSYDQYYYENGKLQRISSFQSDGTNFKNKTYTYNSTGYSVKYENASDYSISTYLNDLLTKVEYYSKGRLIYIQRYQYGDDNKLINRTYYDEENIASFVTDYFYNEGLCVKTFTHPIDSYEFMSDERMIYDKNNNLILKIENIPSLSSSSFAKAFYVFTRYQYY